MNPTYKFDIKIEYYEKLKQNPVEHVKQICEFAKINYTKNLMEIVNQPSYTTHKRSPVMNKPHHKASTSFLQKDRDLVNKILDSVGIEYPVLYIFI